MKLVTVLGIGLIISAAWAARVDALVIEEHSPDLVQAQVHERLFVKRANHVAALWTQLTKDYNEKHAFNVRVAREISKAFHDLEKDENWPKDRLK
ncbi:MAG: hypothetical protein LAP61_18445 [Acidobacteriia bacterium]|nr:hypothetical protein [Terriglobia bacterium]